MNSREIAENKCSYTMKTNKKGGEFNVYSPHFVEVNSEGQIIYFEYLSFGERQYNHMCHLLFICLTFIGLLHMQQLDF